MIFMFSWKPKEGEEIRYARLGNQRGKIKLSWWLKLFLNKTLTTVLINYYKPITDLLVK